MGERNKRTKWKYVLRIAFFWGLILTTTRQIFDKNVLFNGVDFTTKQWVVFISDIIGGTIILFPMGILVGLLLWKDQVKSS